ncbi:CELR2 protein, partial [Herpetotheres cachinnans]|nr:CELR2 protein [Herpetotheres cachinnans]
MSAVGWALLEGLHLYRRRSEPRHVDRGPMRFYHVLGWGLPAFITGLAVGLDPEGYGNPDFCWLSIHDSLVWSLAGPIACAVAVSIFFLVLAARATCATPQGFEKKGTASGLQTAVVVLALPSLAWLLALLSWQDGTVMVWWGTGVMGWVVGHCWQGGSVAGEGVAGTHGCGSPLSGREDSGLAGSPGQRALAEPGGLFLDTQDQPEEHDTDSDSDLSLEDDRSGSYGSTHSSESEDEAVSPGWDTLPGPPLAPPAPGDSLVAPGQPYWPGEFVTTASDSEGHGGSETLRVEPAGGEGPPRGEPPRLNGEALPRDPLLLPLPHPHKGILKKKCLPPISERGSTQRLGPPPPPPAGTAASSGSEGSRVGGTAAPRPRQTLQEQLSGVTPIAMSIKAGTVDEDSSGSE